MARFPAPLQRLDGGDCKGGKGGGQAICRGEFRKGGGPNGGALTGRAGSSGSVAAARRADVADDALPAGRLVLLADPAGLLIGGATDQGAFDVFRRLAQVA